MIFEFSLLPTDAFFSTVIKNYVFFNILHIPITLWLLFYLPEFKTWVQEKESYLVHYKFEMIAIFLGLVVFSFFGWQLGSYTGLSRQYSSDNIRSAFILVFIILNVGHGLGQVKGLSFLINKSVADSEKNRSAESRERKLFSLTIFSLILYSVINLQGPVYLSLKLELGPILNTLSVLYSVFAGLIFVNAFTYEFSIRKLKVMFLLRILVYAVILKNSFALFAVQCLHGIEYLFVTKKLLKSSEISAEQKIRFSRILQLICVCWGIFVLPRYYYLNQWFNAFSFTLLMSLTTAMDLLHYILDRQLFKMQTLVSRRNVLPLIAKKTG